MKIFNMPAGELILWILGVLFTGSTIVEIVPIKLNPWSALLRWVGRALNAEVLDKVKEQEKKLQTLEKNLQALQDSEDGRHAKAARTRVLRFGDEVLHGVRHSKEHFDDILLDISEYDIYCATHKEFKNGRMQLASQHIQETYRKCLDENSFL